MSLSMRDLFTKYDTPAPRYTSYPTVPYWDTTPDSETWIQSLRESLSPADSSWSLYLHIPFCETLCTFCGCNNVITKNHSGESAYVDSILREWSLYKSQVPELLDRDLKQVHLGGGTPTFLSSPMLEKLLRPFLNSDLRIAATEFEASIEVDPRRTSFEQLLTLRNLGFNRISLGVQDFNPEVQKLVNRTQSFELTAKMVDDSRKLGYQSVNLDLIYGLAKQSVESMIETIELTLRIRPDRIALYSFALVPWIKPAQRLFKDSDLPKAEEKRQLYDVARSMLLESGYVEIGMDHFGLVNDSLTKALMQKRLHRNFMGYTDNTTDLLLGLGVSSISESRNIFHQNEKVLPKYQESIERREIPTFRGHVLNDEDKFNRARILSFMTNYEVKLSSDLEAAEAKSYLSEMFKDELLEIKNLHLRLTEKGRPFMRNACIFFDQRLRRHKPETQIFSKSI